MALSVPSVRFLTHALKVAELPDVKLTRVICNLPSGEFIGVNSVVVVVVVGVLVVVVLVLVVGVVVRVEVD
jgi:hypothetical protein